MSRAKLPVLAALLAALPAGAAVGAHADVPTYEARYDVEYKGRRVGESVQRVEHDTGTSTYRFESITSARGIARLLRPRPVVEESTFELDASGVRPLEFRVDDGTRKGDDNIAVDFDWAAGTARIVTSEGRVDLPLEPGVHDRATLQIALMLELAAGREPVPHELIDDRSVKRYTYEVDGTETLETPAGTYETVRVTQRRDGSSRYTIFWAAPVLQHLPVKVEQRRDGETLTTLTLAAIEGI